MTIQNTTSRAQRLVAPLSGCGFHSVYGHYGDDESSVATAMNQIAIDNIPERIGQMLRNDLIDKMYGKGRPVQPQYTLVIKVRTTEEDLGIQLNATSARILMNMYADYDLKDTNDKVILHGAAHSITSFSKFSNQYGTLTAREDAQKRTTSEVSEQIVNRVSMYLTDPQPVTAADHPL